MTKSRVLVVGGGIAGLATAWALVKRGFAVEVFEQGTLPNPLGSSFDEHRIIRHVYGELHGYARLMPAAFAAWQELWDDLGEAHLEPRPSAYFLPEEDDNWVSAVSSSLSEVGLPLTEFDPAGAHAAFPMIRTERFKRIFQAGGAGILFPERILHGLVAWLHQHQVPLHTGMRVTRVEPGRAQLVAGGRIHRADWIVVAAGAWVDRLLPALRGLAVPSRQAVMYLQPPPSHVDAWGQAPVAIVRGEATGLYVLPPCRGTRLKVGDHSFSRQGDPDEDRLAGDGDVARLEAALGHAFRDAKRYRVLQRKACFYTVTEDERFHVAPIEASTIVISACSGHGFKFGALIGQRVAQSIAGEVHPASLGRWARGEAVGD